MDRRTRFLHSHIRSTSSSRGKETTITIITITYTPSSYTSLYCKVTTYQSMLMVIWTWSWTWRYGSMVIPIHPNNSKYDMIKRCHTPYGGPCVWITIDGLSSKHILIDGNASMEWLQRIDACGLVTYMINSSQPQSYARCMLQAGWYVRYDVRGRTHVVCCEIRVISVWNVWHDWNGWMA